MTIGFDMLVEIVLEIIVLYITMYIVLFFHPKTTLEMRRTRKLELAKGALFLTFYAIFFIIVASVGVILFFVSLDFLLSRI